MDNVSIISYPSSRDDSLLSLTESRSRYMLPFGGRFRVVDFTIRNSFSCNARHTVIYNNLEDDLEDYVEGYGPFADMNFPPLRVVSRDFSDINFCYNLIMDTNTAYYIIYNGDNPSIIDFEDIMNRYKKKKADSVLFRMNVDGKPTMAYKLLVTKQKTLLKAINKAIKEDRTSPNIFEMLINMMINDGIKKSDFSAPYWPVRNVPEYFNLSREIIWNTESFDLLFNEKIIQSQIKTEDYATIGRSGKIVNSFISDFCHINGRVENSIIYPGVVIGDSSFIKDSIILPFVRIGAGVKIMNTIVDENTEYQQDSISLNISDMCRVGSDETNLKNSDFPRSLFSGITLIGKNCRIHDANIGGACYVASGLGGEFFSSKKYLYDGLSVV